MPSPSVITHADSPTPEQSRFRRAILLRVAAAAVALVPLSGYGIHLLSPLRLNFDAVLLLRMAMAYQEGRGWNPPDVGSQHPIGYPALVVVLERIGLASQAGFAAVNLLALAVGVWASATVIGRVWPDLRLGLGQLVWHPAWVLAAIAPASWIMVKHASLPLTDVPYFGVSMLCVAALERAWRGDRARVAWLVVGVALALAAVLTRTIGIALIPAVMLAGIGQPRAGKWLCAARARPMLLIVACALAVLVTIAAAAVVVQTTYWTGFVAQYQSTSVAGAIFTTAQYRLLDLGEAVLNVPNSAVPAMGVPVLMAAGALGYIVLAIGMWRARRSISPVWVYFTGYSAIVLIWPFGDPRFWLPVLPIAAAFGLVALGGWTSRAAGRAVIALGMAVFAGLGLLALAVTARVSLSGEQFPAYYNSGVYRDTYLAAWQQKHDRSKVDPKVLGVLERYEPRARMGTP